MRDSILASYARLRLSVGCLGEKALESWWPTAFFETTSQCFLEPIFPRSYRLSQYHGIRASACRLHDEFIGIGNAFHLFRLPEEVEQDLQTTILKAPEEWFAEVNHPEQALSVLKSLTTDTVDVSEGPKAIGNLKALYQPSAPQMLAQYYLGAFSQGVRCFPYFANAF
jgi:hypothetical protein